MSRAARSRCAPFPGKDPVIKAILTIAVSATCLLLAVGCTSATEQSKEALDGTQAPSTGAVTNQSTPAPAPAKPSQPSPLVVKEQGFGQGTGFAARTAGFAFIVENPNETHAAESVSYQVAAYDAAGTVLKTESSYISVVLPGQRLGMGGSLYLDEGQTIARLEVQVKTTRFKKLDTPLPAFTMEGVAYRADRYSQKAVGVVKNPYPQDVKQVRVAAVAYDGAGQIIGGGFTYLDFVPAQGQAAVEVSLNAAPGVARVELYATLSGLSTFS